MEECQIEAGSNALHVRIINKTSSSIMAMVIFQLSMIPFSFLMKKSKVFSSPAAGNGWNAATEEIIQS